ncbi:hypothetical protein PFISCL1PPCAC_2789, partial [Pristionchus fissidentatus]
LQILRMKGSDPLRLTMGVYFIFMCSTQIFFVTTGAYVVRTAGWAPVVTLFVTILTFLVVYWNIQHRLARYLDRSEQGKTCGRAYIIARLTVAVIVFCCVISVLACVIQLHVVPRTETGDNITSTANITEGLATEQSFLTRLRLKIKASEKTLPSHETTVLLYSFVFVNFFSILGTLLLMDRLHLGPDTTVYDDTDLPKPRHHEIADGFKKIFSKCVKRKEKTIYTSILPQTRQEADEIDENS